MTDEDRKILTEYLGECWHVDSGTHWFSPGIMGTNQSIVEDPIKCNLCSNKHRESQRRTWDTWDDLEALKKKMVEKGDWYSFKNFVHDRWRLGNYREDKVDWLFTPSRFCQLVAEALKKGVLHCQK